MLFMVQDFQQHYELQLTDKEHDTNERPSFFTEFMDDMLQLTEVQSIDKEQGSVLY